MSQPLNTGTLILEILPEHAGAADLFSLTADIVVAFLANDSVDPFVVPEVISATQAAPLHLTAFKVAATREAVSEEA